MSYCIRCSYLCITLKPNTTHENNEPECTKLYIYIIFIKTLFDFCHTGGTLLTIDGSGFDMETTVMMGDNECLLTTQSTYSTIYCIIPPAVSNISMH